MSFPWVFIFSILSAIFYVIKILSSIFKLFQQISEYSLETRQGLEIISVDNSTFISMYIILYSFT